MLRKQIRFYNNPNCKGYDYLIHVLLGFFRFIFVCAGSLLLCEGFL